MREARLAPSIEWPQTDVAGHAAGGFVLLSLVIGGGTDKGLASDLLLEVMALPFVCLLVLRFPDRRADRRANILVAAIAAVLLIQLVPSFGLLQRPFLVAIDGGRSLDSAAMALVWLAIFYWAVRLGRRDQELILRYALAGVGLNLAFSFIQFGSRTFGLKAQFLPHQMNAGFFANENHLAALFVISVPLIIALLRRWGAPYLAVPVIGVMVVYQFVVGSQAGVLLIFASVLLSYAVLSRSLKVRALHAMGGLAVVGLAGWFYAQAWLSLGEGPLSRGVFAAKTWQAAIDDLPLGVGFGNFLLVYPRYETTADIVGRYVNHAHNDYLELLLEGGLLAAALMLAYLALLIWRTFRDELTGLQKAAACAIAVLLLHSLVDYPLRTMALGVLFAVLNGVLFRARQTSRSGGRI